jgi:hypothetical protein
MKKFSKINESLQDKEWLMNYFRDTIDLCSSFKYDYIFMDKNFDDNPNNWLEAYDNEFSDDCVKGYQIVFNPKYISLGGMIKGCNLKEYVKFLVELDSDMNRFKVLENVSYMDLEIHQSSITLTIKM